jgi:hypothetical protein
MSPRLSNPSTGDDTGTPSARAGARSSTESWLWAALGATSSWGRGVYCKKTSPSSEAAAVSRKKEAQSAGKPQPYQSIDSRKKSRAIRASFFPSTPFCSFAGTFWPGPGNHLRLALSPMP